MHLIDTEKARCRYIKNRMYHIENLGTPENVVSD